MVKGIFGMGNKRLRFGFDLLGTKVYAFRGGATIDGQVHAPAGKEEITEEFERAMAMYIGNGGPGTRLIQYEEDGELLTFKVSLLPTETTRRLRPSSKERFKPLTTTQEEWAASTVFWMVGVLVIGFFLTSLLGQ